VRSRSSRQEYRERFPGRDPDELTDEDLLREVMNTVGKPGKLGEHVKCVVSVSMLTEGWDANTVTHVLGVRAFGTQLLCEQVVGRALRRRSYAPSTISVEVDGEPVEFSGFDAEYAEVYGVPFSFIPCAGSLKQVRDQEIQFLLAKRILEKYYRPEEGEPPKVWLFPQLLAIVREWYEGGWVDCKDDAFPQLLYFAESAHNAADRIYRSIAAAEEGSSRLRPILAPYEWERTTDHVDFDTTRPVYATKSKCPVSHIVCDTNSWEQKVAQALEEMDEVVAYVKNDRQPGFSIPYTVDGDERHYYPDFIARVADGFGQGEDDLLNVIIEVTGEKKKEKEAKVATAQRLWVPAVNNHGGFGRWAVVEVTDPWRTKTLLRQALAAPAAA
jgi:hypothetical protein